MKLVLDAFQGGKLLIELFDLAEKFLLHLLLFGLQLYPPDFLQLVLKGGLLDFEVGPGLDLEDRLLLLFLDFLPPVPFHFLSLVLVLVVVFGSSHAHARDLLAGLGLLLFLEDVLLDVLFGDLDFCFGDFDVLVDVEEDIALLEAEVPVDFPEALVKGLQLLDKSLFGVPQFLEAGVELFLLLEEVLVVQEEVLLLPADVEPLVFGDLVVGRALEFVVALGGVGVGQLLLELDFSLPDFVLDFLVLLPALLLVLDLGLQHGLAHFEAGGGPVLAIARV